MRVLVQGGTHLGVKGCYREKVFTIDSLDELEGLIRKQFNLQSAVKGTYGEELNIVHTLEDQDGKTLFEYRVVEVINKEDSEL